MTKVRVNNSLYQPNGGCAGEGMSLRVFLAHTGLLLTADPHSFVSLEEFRSWIAKRTSVDASQQILMTTRGKQVKLQTLISEQEIFVYDRRVLATSSSHTAISRLPKSDIHRPFLTESAPSTTQKESTLSDWQKLFKRRRDWAVKVADGCRNVVEGIASLETEIGVIQKGVRIAVENVKQHFANLQPKYLESKTWADQVCEDQTFLLDHWQDGLSRLGSLKACEELGQCILGARIHKRHTGSSDSSSRMLVLRDFVDQLEVGKAANSGRDTSRRLLDHGKDLDTTFNSASRESSRIIETVEQNVQYSQRDFVDSSDRLMEEIDILAQKLNADYEHVLGLPNTQKSVSQAAKISSLHKTNFIFSLKQTNDEINQLITQSEERREQRMKSSAQYLQEISIVESIISAVHSKLAKLEIDDENEGAFEILNFVVRLPSTYGSLLVECVRRQEWADKMTTDSSSLVEELATYKEDESKRRKKWTKEMKGAIDFGSLDGIALGIEVNVQSQKQKWPKVKREDIVELIESLQEFGDIDGAQIQIEELLKSLDAPSKQQTRRVKAFKNGSVHEATFGRSLLLRGDDEVLLAIRNDKSRAEEKLKSAESRIRKLEDLLHRQSQTTSFSSRPTSAAGIPASGGPLFERHVTAPVTNFSSALSKARDTGSRRSSVSSRRVSMNNDPEEKALAQRIVKLEADLMNEKAQSATLATKVASRSDAEDLLKSQIREAISTKEDLLGNLEAQQREFDDERRLLREENSKVKVQLEQLEDEFDRVLDNREHDEKIRVLEEELEQMKREASIEIERAQSQTQSLQSDVARKQEQLQAIQSQLREQEEEKTELTRNTNEFSSRLRNHDQAQADHHKTLRGTLVHLSDEEETPADFGALVNKIEKVAEKSAAHLKDIKDTLANLRADNMALEARAEGQDEEIYDLRERLGSQERKNISLHEKLGLAQKQGASLQAQLDFERDEHEQLKARFAAGETDSNSLRSELTEKEHRIAEILGQIAKHEVQHKNLSSQLEGLGAELEDEKDSHNKLLAVMNARIPQAADISDKLLRQNAVLERLLEHIGLVVTREDDKMIVQKAPKGTSTSTVLSDPSASMKRSLSAPMSAMSDQIPSAAFETVHWMDRNDPEETERRFDAFQREVSNFDMDVFTEAVYKRVKDIEHIARKWQKEARAYRDKSHRAQSEVHDRIALRNFKEGDLALFLPTRDQATKPWAAFNVGAPHCFLREQDSHNLAKRDWLIARISKVEERVVDLARSINGGLKVSSDQKLGGDKSDAASFTSNENPYELSDGLRWYLIDAAEEKPGAPINIGTGKVTVASANVDAKGSIRMKKPSDANGATKTLTRSLDSRRSSTNSRKGLVAVTSNSPAATNTGFDGMVEQSIDNAAAAAAAAPSSTLQMSKDSQHPHTEESRPRSSQTSDVPVPASHTTDHVGEFSSHFDL